jgi:type II secretory pathway component PulJ
MTPTRGRSGFTLVELLLVVGAITILLGLCAGLIHSLLRLDRIGRAHLGELAALGRVARQFRQDVRAAIRVEPAPGAAESAARLVLTQPAGRVVEYQARGAVLVRAEREGGQARRQEEFGLRSRGGARFLAREGDPGVFVTLVFARTAARTNEPLAAELRVEALLGKDHRFETTAKDGP